MKFLNDKYYVEVKDKRYLIHPTENKMLELRGELKYLKIQYQVQINAQIRKNRKVIKNDIDELLFENYLNKKQKPIIEPPIFKQPHFCPGCKQNSLIDFDKGWFCQICQYIVGKQTSN